MEPWKKQVIESQEIPLCPDYCEYLSITEGEQNRHPEKPDHICLKYNVRVIHSIFHPKLIRYDQCNLIIFETESNSKLSDTILSNLVSYLEKNVKNFPSLKDKTVKYSYDSEYRIIALWWDMGAKYEVSEEFCVNGLDYVLDYDTEERIKGIEIFEFFPEKYEGE